MTTENTKRLHPLDWKKEKKTGHPTYCLGIALSWHRRMVETGGDTMASYEGVVVDPLGNETSTLTEEQYDDMIASAQKLFADVRTAAASRPQPIAAKFVRILVHPNAHHAVIVRMPGGLDATAYVAEQRNAVEGQELVVKTMSFSTRMLWPADGTAEKQDLMDLFPLAFSPVYPDEFMKLAGWRGTDVKKLA